MAFKPPKRKRWAPQSVRLPPLPVDASADTQIEWSYGLEKPPVTYHGLLKGDQVLVEGEHEALWLYRQGFFGKGSQSRGASQRMNYVPDGVEIPPHLQRPPRPPANPEGVPVNERTNEGEPSPNSESCDVMEKNECAANPNASSSGEAQENVSQSNTPVKFVAQSPQSDWDPSGIPSTLVAHWVESNPDSESTNGQPSFGVRSEPMNCAWTAQECHVLGPEEAFFLAYALGCLTVYKDAEPISNEDLWRHFVSSNHVFVSRYVAYHHYRSKGWVPKCGLKYAADFVIYKRGPLFYHSSFCCSIQSVDSSSFEPISLVPSSQLLTWQSLVAMQRLTEGVAKELLVCYVLYPPDTSDTHLLDPMILQTLSLQEMVLRRWKPEQTAQKSA